MASVPALTPLIRLSQQIEGMMKLVGIDPSKRLNPVVGLREAKQHGHKAPFPEDKCLGVLSTTRLWPFSLPPDSRKMQPDEGFIAGPWEAE
jgi:hypothetical protein